MQIKSYKKSGPISWCNSKSHSDLLCCAPYAPNEDNLYSIDILSFDLADRSQQLNLVGSVNYARPFRCIAWDCFGEKSNTYPYGLIFGGLNDGSFNLWNPAEIIKQGLSTTRSDNLQDQAALLYQEEPDDDAYPILCAQWNSLKNNLLAFGSLDVLMIDIGKDVTTPQLVKPGRGNPHEGSYITSVSWNRQVSHILASASENGLIALWDIKSDRSIFQFKDSPNSYSGSRNVVICWSKNISTQIAVTLDDQKKNQLQIWDLRNQKGPIIVIDKGHTKGINSMDWSQTDPELILTAGHDKKAICWNYTRQQSFSQLNMKSEIIDIKWSKRLPSIFSITCQDSISIATLNDANLFSYVPKWYKVQNGNTFHCNDTILTYSESRGNVLHQYKINLPLDKEINTYIDDLDLTIKGKSKHNAKDNDKQLWELIQSKQTSDNEDIYNYLGLNKAKIIKQVQKYTGKKSEMQASNSMESSKSNNFKRFTNISGADASDFFSNISNVTAKQTNEQQQQDNVKYDMVPRNFNWDLGKQRIIKQNILIGNYGGAIDASLKCGRTAQALIIAYSVSPQTFSNTLKTFFTQTTDTFITDTLKHLAYRDTQQLVKKYEITKWKECIALVFSIANDKRIELLSLLANRIKDELENLEAVVICLVLAEQFNKIGTIFYQQLNQMKGHSSDRKCKSLIFAEKLIAIHQTLTTLTTVNEDCHKIIRQAAFVCIQQGKFSIANKLLTYFGKGKNEGLINIISQRLDASQKVETAPSKPILLPVMKPRKQQTQKKQIKGQQQAPVNIKPSAGKGNPPPPKQFAKQAPQQDTYKPLPPGKKDLSSSQPYNNQEVHEPKKINPPFNPNRNQPPPPPSNHKVGVPKPNIIPAPNMIQEKPQQQVQSFNPRFSQPQRQKQTIHNPPPPPPIKKTPPPPPPKIQTPHKQQSNNSQSQQQQQFQNPPLSIIPNQNILQKKQIRPPPPKQVVKSMPPPPTHKTQPKQEQVSNDSNVQTSPKVIPQQIPQQVYQQPQPEIIPPKAQNLPKPVQKIQEQSPEQSSSTVRRPPPPPVKKTVPPPPPGKR